MTEDQQSYEDEYPTAGSRRKGRSVPGCIAVLVALAVIAGGFYFAVTKGVAWVSDQFEDAPDYPGPGKGKVVFEVESGDVSAQICRNLLMVVTARRGYPYVDEPLMALVHALVRDTQREEPPKSWDAQLLVCRYLYDVRETSDRLLDRLGPPPAQRVDMIVHAVQLLTQLQAGRDVAPLIEGFLEAEKQKSEWWARGGASPA